MARTTKYTKEILIEAAARSINYSDMLRYLGANPTGSTRKHIQKKLIEYKISTDHFVKMPVKFVKHQEDFVARTLIKNPAGIRTPGRKLRKAMIELGMAYECSGEGCPNPQPMWRGEPLVLEVDHKDGDYTNNIISNLRFLCPNCHTQTETFGFVSRKEKLHCACGTPMHKDSTQCLKCHRKSQAQTREFFQERTEYPSTSDLISGVEKFGYAKYGATIQLTDTGLRRLLLRRGVKNLPKKLTKASKAVSI